MPGLLWGISKGLGRRRVGYGGPSWLDSHVGESMPRGPRPLDVGARINLGRRSRSGSGLAPPREPRRTCV
eukprot:6748142-Pyramimonas_sp.AAC.1